MKRLLLPGSLWAGIGLAAAEPVKVNHTSGDLRFRGIQYRLPTSCFATDPAGVRLATSIRGTFETTD